MTLLRGAIVAQKDLLS